MSLPYYKRFPRDFLEGTIGLPFEVKCAYAVVLDLIYMRAGRLPDDARYIAGQLGCSVRKWTAIRSALIEAGKLSCVGGIISNFRADYLLEETRKYQDNQAENRGRPNKNNGLQPPPSHQAEAESEPEKVAAVEAGADATDDWPEGDTRHHVRLLVEGADSPRLDLDRSPGLITTSGEVARWRREGCSWTHDVEPAVLGLLAKPRGQPIGSWTYFTSAVAENRARNLAALELPAHERLSPGPPNDKRQRKDRDLAAVLAGSDLLAQARAAGERDF